MQGLRVGLCTSEKKSEERSREASPYGKMSGMGKESSGRDEVEGCGGYTWDMVASTTTHTTLLGRLAGGGDRAAWDEFCARYRELIQGFARRQNLQAADCDDIVQEVLLKLSKSMPGFQYDPSKGKFRSYLKTVVLHAIFDRTSQKQGAQAVGTVAESTRLASEDEEVDRQWEVEWRRYHLRRAMQTIEAEFNAKDVRAFQMYGVEGGEARATAEALGLSVDQVYQAKSTILRRISQLIARQIEEEG